jgi:SAM-dependent methyltransferase
MSACGGCFEPIGFEVMDKESIRKAFDVAASLYAYRLPYHGQFFADLAGRIGLRGKEQVLDLCCGSGAIVRGLAPRVGSVVGLDFSAEMLGLAPSLPNAEYRRISVEEHAEGSGSGSFDLISVGHGIHWIDPKPLATILSRDLKTAGRVIILGNQWAEETPWIGQLRRVEAPFKSFDVFDVNGQRKLGALGFRMTDRAHYKFQVDCDLPFLEKHVTSYARYTEKILRQPEEFSRRMREALSPFADTRGNLRGFALNWACIYTRE